MLAGISGEKLNGIQFRHVKPHLPTLLADITLFPVTTTERLNLLLQNLDASWVSFVPNCLDGYDALELFGAKFYRTAKERLRTITRKKDFNKFIATYTKLGYVKPAPPQWPKRFQKPNLADYNLVQLIQFAELVLGFNEGGDCRHRLMERIFCHFRADAATTDVCGFCRCNFGVLQQNFMCSHIPFYHNACMRRFIQGSQYVPRCPFILCPNPSPAFQPEPGIIDLNALGSCCDLCFKPFTLNEFYNHTLCCGHSYHIDCYSLSPIVQPSRRCVNPNCETIFSLSASEQMPLAIPPPEDLTPMH